MNEPDPEAQEKTATLDGHYGAEIQFQAVQARTRELVRLAFDFVRIIPASGAAIIPGGAAHHPPRTMITQDQWERMTPGEQAEAWWQELSGMIREAMEGLHYTPGNGQTLVVSGLTTIVGKKETPDSGS